MKRAMIFLAISFFVLSSTFVFAEDNSSMKPSAGEIAGDVLWVRPLGFIGTAFKAITYVISLPVTSALKKKNEAKEFLIEDPCHYYFKRPLGEF